MTMYIYVSYKSTRCACSDAFRSVANASCIYRQWGCEIVTPLVAPPNDMWDHLVRWLQVQPDEIDDYTASLEFLFTYFIYWILFNKATDTS